MKRKTPFTSSIKNKSNSDSTGHIEETSGDDLSLKETVGKCLDDQPNKKKVVRKGLICNQISREQFISAANDLGLDKKQLDNETWRLNDFTRSKESVWSRLISKFELSQTENIRHSLYTFWRRNRENIAKDLSEIQMDSVEEDDEFDKRNEVDPSSLNSEIKPLTSIASIPYPATLPAREGLFGLLRNDYSEKPSFRAVKNLIHILSDKGPSFQPTAVNYVLSGSLENIRHILFQKRTGDFYLMVWLEISSWDPRKRTDLYPSSQQVTLTLQANTNISNALIYAWNNTGDVNIVNVTIINNQIAFNATDKMSIIKLSAGETAFIPIGVYRLLPKTALHSSLDLHGQRNSRAVIKPQHWSNVNQHWMIKPENDGFYRLINRGTGQVLEMDEDGVRLNDWSESNRQKWKIDPLPNGYYHLTSKIGDNQWTTDNQL